jgi:hypothetical protein
MILIVSSDIWKKVYLPAFHVRPKDRNAKNKKVKTHLGILLLDLTFKLLIYVQKQRRNQPLLTRDT